MRYIYLFLVLIQWCHVYATTPETVRDSLERAAVATTDMAKKAIVYRNLADMYLDRPEEMGYLRSLYNTASQAKETEMVCDALSDLCCTFIKKEEIDSVFHYMALLEKAAGAQIAESYTGLIRMKLFSFRASHGNKKTEAALDDALRFLKNADKNNVYVQIEQAYITGNSLFDLKKYDEASPYLQRAYELSTKLQGKQGTKYRVATQWLYANAVKQTGHAQECLELLEETLQLHKSSYEKYYARTRPYYQINRFYLQCYASILMRIEILSEEKLDYYIKEVQRITPTVTETFDKYNCYLALNNYYLFEENYKEALKTNDSLINYAQELAPMNRPSLINLQSQIYEQMGDYRRALEESRRYVQLKDSLTSQQMQEKLNTLQVEYGVDKLNFEKTSLENRNRKVIVIALSIIILMMLTICTYLYWNLKKEKLMKMQLFKLNQKAGESDQIKSAFINSVCHEIRTPLNAIVGFSTLITDETIDNESKREFSELITSNTDTLTQLVDQMLAVANLDAMSEMLPREETDMKDICNKEFDRPHKKGIKYTLELPEEDVRIATDGNYLSQVLRNLLDNADKFTDQGQICLKLSVDTSDHSVLIRISDTGCGIPADKYEYVFDRFTKLCSFVQGNGLGLYLCRTIITRLGGTIRIDPDYTGGACFEIRLPA